jgi:ATP-dependent DNA helicase Q1
MSKSLDGFYQESGRAGRDGNDADCVLYFRGQDASRLSALTCAEPDGQDKCASANDPLYLYH